MSEQRLVPKRRFKGFEGEWEEVQFGSLAEIVRGASPRPIQDPKWFDESSDIGWLRISDVTVQDGRIHNIEQKLSLLGQKKTRVVKESHLLLSIAATVGKPVINYVPTGVHDGFLIFFKPKFDIEYMYQWLEMFQNNWLKYGQPGSQVNLNSNIVKHHYLKIPSNNEQQKIGRFFKLLDKRIANQERKIAKLKDIKSAYLTEMFPQEGETVPKRRFFGFLQKWKRTKLGEICIVKTGYAFNSNDFDQNGQFLVITNGNIQQDAPYVDDSVGNKINVEDVSIVEEYVLNKNDILVTMDGTVGRTAKVIGENQILAQRVGRLIAKLDSEFLYQSLNTGDFLKEMNLISSGGTIKHISLSEISDYKINIPPSEEEQEKIGSFFKNLDNQIETEEKKLAKLKAMKEAYLEEMFV